MLRCTSGRDACRTGLRQADWSADSVLGAGSAGSIVWSCTVIQIQFVSKSGGEAGERVEIIRCAGDAKITAAIELKVPSHHKFKAAIHRRNPSGMVFCAAVAEKFRIAAQPADNGVSDCDGVDEIRIKIAIVFVVQATDRRFQPKI